MNLLSDTLRELMDRHDLTGAKLSEEIGVSAVSVSHILTGKSRPRQVTLSRMMKRLCENAEDEQALISAYESLGGGQLRVSNIFKDGQNEATEEERVRRFMEMKTQAVAFRREVVAILDHLKVPCRQDVASDEVITDLLIEHNGKRIALECRANVKLDLEKSLISARVIRDELKCDQVFIVVPELDQGLREALFGEASIRAAESQNLAVEIIQLLNLPLMNQETEVPRG